MALKQSQLKANEDYFIMLSKMTKIFIWKDMGQMYDIDDNGNYISHTKRGYEVMKLNTLSHFTLRLNVNNGKL